MFINSYTNCDLNSAQNSALHQVRSCALRAQGMRSRVHTARSRTQRAHVARMLGLHWSRPAQAACLMSRPKTLVATPKHHKATGTMSRHQIGVATPLSHLQVATSKRGRDIVSPAQPQARSRHRNQVATSLETNLCRDIVFMSRPRSCPQ